MERKLHKNSGILVGWALGFRPLCRSQLWAGLSGPRGGAPLLTLAAPPLYPWPKFFPPPLHLGRHLLPPLPLWRLHFPPTRSTSIAAISWSSSAASRPQGRGRRGKKRGEEEGERRRRRVFFVGDRSSSSRGSSRVTKSSLRCLIIVRCEFD